jgi:hypothetical protein
MFCRKNPRKNGKMYIACPGRCLDARQATREMVAGCRLAVLFRLNRADAISQAFPALSDAITPL